TVLFGPRTPDLTGYGDRFTDQHYRGIQQEAEAEAFFLPRAEDVEHALECLTGQRDAAILRNLTADFAIYLARVVDVLGQRHPQDMERMKTRLRTCPWLALAGGGTARAEDVLLPPDWEVGDLIGGAARLPESPSLREKREAFAKALDTLRGRGILS